MSIFDEVKQKKAEYEKAIEGIGRDAFVQAFAAVFAAHPAAIAFRWTQYTPYFNDGSPCEFSVGELTVMVAGAPEGIGDDGYLASWDTGYYVKENRISGDIGAAAAGALKAAGVFVSEEDVLEAVFGDHVQVTVTRDGITVEEYEHD